MGPAAAADCERILDSWWGQPVNTSTSFAFIVAGVLVWWRRRELIPSGLIAGVGFGSIAFHGPMPSWGEFLHDLSIVLTLVWVVLVETRRLHWWLFGIALATALAVTPAVADPAQAVLAFATVTVIAIVPERRPKRLAALAILGGGALIGTLARTGGPLCEPYSIWQGHGLWHVAAATSLALWALLIRPSPLLPPRNPRFGA